jgi:RNA recognition motif-containing protein
MNIYVSNLSAETTGDELKQAFAVFGAVKQVVIVYDEHSGLHEAGRYGYVEMFTKSEGATAISHLNGTLIGGRVVHTIEALPLSNKKMQALSQKQASRPRWAPRPKKVS